MPRFLNGNSGSILIADDSETPLTVCLAMPDTNSLTNPPKRILVVDDGPELPKALRIALTITGGYKIDIAADGNLPLQMIEAVKDQLVIPDFEMPDLDR